MAATTPTFLAPSPPPCLPRLPRARGPTRPLVHASATRPPARPALSVLTSHLPVLPLLVRTARATWRQFWRLMMSELAPSDASGRYVRPTSTRAGTGGEGHAGDRLYVGLACPWCHRVLLARALCGARDVGVEYLAPGEDGLWVLEEDRSVALKAVYLGLEQGYQGRFTAPVLVDEGARAVVSNESADILALLGRAGPVELADGVVVWLRPSVGNEFGVDPVVLSELCDSLYEGVNDGVYRCGFATSQMAYREAEAALFSTLDDVEDRLSRSRFLCSANCITEADVRLFPTVYRFDAVYSLLFKVSRKTIRADYPAISAWMRDMYNLPGVKETCDLDATVNNYFSSLFPLNPSGIVPNTPQPDLSPAPHRQGLGATSQLIA